VLSYTDWKEVRFYREGPGKEGMALALSGFMEGARLGYVSYPEFTEPVHDVPDTMLKIAVGTIDRYIGILFIQQYPLVVHS
jgi:hypothetical protein